MFIGLPFVTRPSIVPEITAPAAVGPVAEVISADTFTARSFAKAMHPLAPCHKKITDCFLRIGHFNAENQICCVSNDTSALHQSKGAGE